MFLLLFVGVAGWVVGAMRLGVARESAPLLAVSLVGSALYLFGLFGLLHAGAWLVLAIGVALFAYHLALARRNEAIRRFLCSVPFVLFLIGFFFFGIRVRGWRCLDWDEFTHWGFATKELLRTHALMSADNALIFKDYPPGSSIWQYLFNLVLGPSEGASYFAICISLTAALTAVVPDGGWRHWKRSLALAGILYLMVHALGHGFHSLYVDHLLAVYFGGALVTYYRSRNSGNPRRLVLLLPILFYLALIKTTGVFLSACVVSVVFADSFAQWWHGNTPGRTALLTLLLLAAPLAGHGTWSVYLQKSRVPSIDTRLAGYRTTEPGNERRKSVSRAFREAIVNESVGNAELFTFVRSELEGLGIPERFRRWLPYARLGTIFWLTVLGAFSFATVTWQRRGEDRQRTWLNQAVLLVNFAIFLAALWSLYDRVYPEVEARRVASYGRYVGTFILGWMLANVAAYFDALSEAEPSVWLRRVACIIPLLLFLFSAPVFSGWLFFKQWPTIRADFGAVRKAAALIASKIPPKSKVYLIWQDSNGFERYVLNYEIAPSTVNHECWSLGRRYSAADTWTCPKNRDEWFQSLRHYDFVVVGKADGNFWNEYGEIFPNRGADRRSHLYEVRRTNEKRVALIPR